MSGLLRSETFSTDAQRRRGLEIVWCGILLIVAAAIFGRGVSRHLHEDDQALLSSTRPEGLRSVGRWFSLEVARATGGFRPAVLATSTVTQLFGEGRPQHVASVALHVAAAMLLFLVVRSESTAHPAARRRTDRLWPAAVASLFFLLHPLHDEAVFWFSAIGSPLVAAAGLLWWTLADAPQPALRAASWLALVVALLAHPAGAAFPLARLLLPLAPGRSRGVALTTALVSLGWLLVSLRLSAAPAFPGLSEVVRRAALLGADSTWPTGPTWLAAALLAGLVLVTVLHALRRETLAAAGLTLLLVSAALASLGVDPTSPRAHYLPILGLALALGSQWSLGPGKLTSLALGVFVLAHGAGENARRADAWNPPASPGDGVLQRPGPTDRNR